MTNAIETHGYFPGDDAGSTLIGLAQRGNAADRVRTASARNEEMNQLTSLRDDRFAVSGKMGTGFPAALLSTRYTEQIADPWKSLSHRLTHKNFDTSAKDGQHGQHSRERRDTTVYEDQRRIAASACEAGF